MLFNIACIACFYLSKIYAFRSFYLYKMLPVNSSLISWSFTLIACCFYLMFVFFFSLSLLACFLHCNLPNMEKPVPSWTLSDLSSIISWWVVLWSLCPRMSWAPAAGWVELFSLLVLTDQIQSPATSLNMDIGEVEDEIQFLRTVSKMDCITIEIWLQWIISWLFIYAELH